MSRHERFSMHYLHVWAERSGDERLPDWLRVAALAYGNQRKNGHAPFTAGYLSRALAKVNPHTGELVPNANVSRAIKTAVELNFLSRHSGARCLVVPPHMFKTPADVGAFSPCPIHGSVAA